MWSKDKLDMLRVIHGENLSLIGDAVVVDNEDNVTCSVITDNGEELCDEPIYGVGYSLGRGGYHYIILTNERAVKANQRNRMGTSRVLPYTYGNATGESARREYVYKIFDSKFLLERSGRVSTYDFPRHRDIVIDVGGKLLNFVISDRRLIQKEGVTLNFLGR